MEFENIYTGSQYLEATEGTWGAVDSHWKAAQVMKMIERHNLTPTVIGEVGCGSGVALSELSQYPLLDGVQFVGYDISSHAVSLAKELESETVRFHLGDPLTNDSEAFDILVALDVFEHVPDYLGFLELCCKKATFKIYHIPLDIHVSSVIRSNLTHSRYTIGHLHYFDADSALATLEDTGHEVVDFFYTSGAIDLFKEHRTLKTALANGPRWLISKFSTPLAARLLGGYSLLVLAK